MRLHYLSGDRAGALRQYKRCEASLQEELCVQPDRSTRTLYQQILADQLDATSEINTLEAITNEESALLTNILGHLKQFQIVQADLQHQVQHNIQVIEQALKGNERLKARVK